MAYEFININSRWFPDYPDNTSFRDIEEDGDWLDENPQQRELLVDSLSYYISLFFSFSLILIFFNYTEFLFIEKTFPFNNN